MNALLYKLLIVALFVGLSEESVSTTECYECEGFGTNSACRNRLDSSMIKVCPDPEFSCGFIELDHFWFFYTKRACGKKFDEKDDILEDYARQTGMRVSATMCSTNLCNKHVDLSKRMIIFICAMSVLSLLFTCLFILMKKRRCC